LERRTWKGKEAAALDCHRLCVPLILPEDAVAVLWNVPCFNSGNPHSETCGFGAAGLRATIHITAAFFTLCINGLQANFRAERRWTSGSQFRGK
jgi:hypothetical protein